MIDMRGNTDCALRGLGHPVVARHGLGAAPVRGSLGPLPPGGATNNVILNPSLRSRGKLHEGSVLHSRYVNTSSTDFSWRVMGWKPFF